MKKSAILVLLFCLAISVTVGGCGMDNEDGQIKVPDFTVEVVATQGDAGITAEALLMAMMDAEGRTYQQENGNFVAVDDYVNNEVSGWVFYADGAPSEEAAAEVMAVGGKSYALIWGDLVGQNNGAAQEADPDDPGDPSLDKGDNWEGEPQI